MAMEYVSLPRDNSLEELRVVIEEKKGEVKMKFMELKKLLEISENTATNRLDRIYTDVREGVERNERTVTQLEQSRNAVNSTLVDNTMSSFLQTTIQNFDDQIAKARNSACVIPKHISLRWSIEELKQSIENVCEVISSSTVEGQKSEASSQSRTSKRTTNEIASYQTEIRTLQTELAVEREKFLQREELFKQELAKLENEITQDLKSQISQLQKQLESKETENAILRDNLYYSREVLENTKLQLQQTQQSNPTRVQSKRASRPVKGKQAQYTQVLSKHKQQSKYTTTKLFVNGKYSHFYTLNQVDIPSELVGELVVCRSKWKYENVIGTLKVVIPAKLINEKIMAGIEFADESGDCSGSYKGISYFKTDSSCALFIPTTQL